MHDVARPRASAPALSAGWLLVGVALALIPLCIVAVDRPLTEFLVRRIPGLTLLVITPRLLLALAIAAPFIPAVFSRGQERELWKKMLVLISFSVLWSIVVVELVLKRIAGRLTPFAWLRHHQYGFHWFWGRLPRYQSFPSGEAALLMAAIGVLWVLYPKWRWLYAIAFVAEGLALIVLGWHFASDVIAGALVGACGARLALRYAKKV
jgi:membrane-associated phospholipid phosphatase